MTEVPRVSPTAPSLQPAQQQAALQLFQQMRSTGGDPGFINPVRTPVNDATAAYTAYSQATASQLATMDPADPNYPTLRSWGNAMDSATEQMTGLGKHTDALINGDNSGSPISGGLSSNISQAMSAMSLQSQMSGAGLPIEGSSSTSDPCALIGDFFNSIIGAGQELIAKINGLVQTALGAVSQLINQVNTAITAGMAALRQTINDAVGAISEALTEVKDMIAGELEAFAKWLGLNNLFNLSSFLSGIFNNACIAPILNAVAPPAMASILATARVGSTRIGVAALGPIW